MAVTEVVKEHGWRLTNDFTLYHNYGKVWLFFIMKVELLSDSSYSSKCSCEGVWNIFGKGQNADWTCMFSFSSYQFPLAFYPARMAQWWACRTHDLVVVGSRQTFFPAYFLLSPLQKHVRKVVSGFGKKSCVSTGVRKPGNTCVSQTAMIWP